MSVRLLRKPTPGAAFVLGGGGNLGAVQVGMLQALFEAGIVPDVAIGCSVGALNAAGLGADPTLAGVRHLRETWLNLDGDELWPAGRISGLWMLGRKSQAIQPNTGLRRLIERTLPYTQLEDAVIPVHVNATSLETGRGHWFTTGPAVEAILASAALPAVFPPVVVDGQSYVDGGVVDNVPISRALALGARRVFVLHVGNFTRPRQLPRRPIDVLLQSYSIARNHRFLAETDEPPSAVDLVVLPGVDPGRIRRNDFSRSRDLMDRAYAAAKEFLAGHGAAVARG
ncbi:MAG: patatin-like phospholipase family protein [Acidimicrobiia bacterium]|nr:patatin-like phospholipase family protein [Acidimicrobiia bacterium]